ncbi:hypothetical protein P2318_05825 [Myxococcaceae bacterium GXIMD 01537]
MNRLALLLSLCLLPLAAGAQEAPPDAGTPTPPVAAPSPAAAPAPTAAPTPSVGTPPPPVAVPAPEAVAPGFFAAVELRGLVRLPETQVRALAGLPALGPVSGEQVARALSRLARSKLFARVTPAVRPATGLAPVMELTLVEQPAVASVELRGTRDYVPGELLEHIFYVPRMDTQDGTEPLDAERPRVPRAWLALYEWDSLHPGLVRGGVAEALEAGLRELRDDGYLLASLTATLHPDGRLVVEVDEGHVEAVEVEGVDPSLAPRVREALGIQPGDVFLRSDASRGLKRLEERLPFVRVRDMGVRLERDARVVEEVAPDGTRRYRTEETRTSRHARRYDPEEEFWLPWTWHLSDWQEPRLGGITLEGQRVVVHLRPRKPDLDLVPLPVHTQVTGFAPGLRGTLRLFDPKDRVHGTLEGAFFVPLRLGGQRVPDDAEQTRRQREASWLAGAKVALPAAALAEVGAQAYDFVDTLDRWRIGSFDSWMYSFLLNRPDSEYFRRSGVTGFATWGFGDAWLAGVSFQRDEYDSLVSFTPPLSLFRRDSPPFPNPPVTEGLLTSVTARLEYASDLPHSRRVGSLWRTPELSLFNMEHRWPEESAVRGFLTLEVGEAGECCTRDDRFWKLVSDNAVYFITDHEEGVRLRVRAAGGEELPLQKREALGGWSALRGYGFKEFRGTASVLTSAEYRCGSLGAFVDVGTVRQDDGDWTRARLGVGALLYLGDEAHFAVAWRTDERASWTPEARLFFSRPF